MDGIKSHTPVNAQFERLKMSTDNPVFLPENKKKIQ